MSALDAGKAYLAGVLDKLPPELRTQAEATFNDVQAQAALSELGAGVLRQQDYSRHLDATTAERTRATELYNQNKAWFDANKADLEAVPQLLSENAALKAAQEGRPATPPAAPPVAPSAGGGVALEDFQGAIRETLGLFTVIPTLVLQHQQRFNEALTEDQVRGLFEQAQQHNRSIKAQYAITFGEKIAAAEATRVAAYEAKLKADGVAEYQRANPSMPYPVRPTGVSPLDALQTPINPAELTPQALADEYNALVAARS